MSEYTILPETCKNVILSVNPKAGRRSSKNRVERLKNALECVGLNVEVQTDLNIVAQRANELFAANQLRALIGIGGDGTAAELTNRTVPGVPIALLPSGTANILAKHLHYSFKPEKFAQMIAAGKIMRADAARANGRLFLAMVGCGFDAAVVEKVHSARMSNPKGAHINYMSYLRPILGVISKYRYPMLRTEFLNESGEPTGEFYDRQWVFVANVPRYGWGIPMAPRAKFDDGLLDTCLWRGKSLFGGSLLTIFAQLGGLHVHFSSCISQRGKKFRIALSPDQEPTSVPYQLDGDPGGELPVEVEILENRLTLFVRK